MWEKFNTDVLQPHQSDRAGAPMQDQIDQVATMIKNRLRGNEILPICLTNYLWLLHFNL